MEKEKKPIPLLSEEIDEYTVPLEKFETINQYLFYASTITDLKDWELSFLRKIQKKYRQKSENMKLTKEERKVIEQITGRLWSWKIEKEVNKNVL